MKSAIVAGIFAALALPAAARADELPKEYRDCVTKGLEWLAKQQHATATGRPAASTRSP